MKHSPDFIDIIVNAYISGQTIFQIENQWGACPSTTAKYVRLAGFQMRRSGAPTVLTEDQMRLISKEYPLGKITIRELATLHQVHPSVVKHYLRIQGLSIGQAGAQLRRTLPPEVARLNAVYSVYRKEARRKGVVFTLTKEETSLLIFSPCHYCGAPPSNPGQRKPRPTVPYSGIDRINGADGYTPENTHSCCANCNRAKSDRTLEDFYNWIRAIARLHP